jgi:amidase
VCACAAAVPAATPGFNESLTDPTAKPDLSGFLAVKAELNRIIDRVFKKHSLDALVYPETIKLTPRLHSDTFMDASTSFTVNVAGTPVVTVPSTVAPGPRVPFSLAFTGPQYSEATLLALAYDYEQATQLRLVPQLAVANPRPVRHVPDM